MSFGKGTSPENLKGEGRWSAARRNIVVDALRMALRGPCFRSAHRLAALHQRAGQREASPARADMHRRRAADAIRCGVLFRPRIRAELERDAQFGARPGGASSALSRRILRSAPCRKQQLLVMGAGGSPRSPGWLVCVTSRAGAALHSALKNASGQRPHE
jgi:hypothetical protein